MKMINNILFKINYKKQHKFIVCSKQTNFSLLGIHYYITNDRGFWINLVGRNQHQFVSQIFCFKLLLKNIKSFMNVMH